MKGTTMAYIEFDDVVKEYKMGEVRIRALDGADFEVEMGELAVILGSSGAGKNDCIKYFRWNGYCYKWRGMGG